MASKSLLVITDHSTFAKHDSLYSMINSARRILDCNVYAASRGAQGNTSFFSGDRSKDMVKAVILDKEALTYENANQIFSFGEIISVRQFDGVWLRLDQPINREFFEKLVMWEDDLVFINRPSGILQSWSKEFLLRFPHLVPGITNISCFDDVIKRAKSSDIVLKPFFGHGGRGIIRVTKNGWLYSSDVNAPVGDERARKLIESTCRDGCIAMEYLDRITATGDKRIVVANGQVLGAVLRIPTCGSWLGNVARGATSHSSDVAPEEYAMVTEINDVLLDKGIFLYGIDTIEDNKGQRVLSEINVINVGGIVQIEQSNQVEIIPDVVSLLAKIWHFEEGR